MNWKVRTKIFMDSRPLRESIGSSGQIEEKGLRQLVAFLKQVLEEGEVIQYSWIEGSKIVADVFPKQGLRRDSLVEVILENRFRHAQNKDNLVVFENDEITIQNLVTKAIKKMSV